jgi:hypothetical protein
MGVLIGTCVSTLVLLCNVALVAIGHFRSGYDKDGVAVFVQGVESTILRWNTFAHVLINALSTLLLSMSNYTMQVLNSPTRQEIDKAHARGKWFDIGLLSPHNLKLISRKRATFCLLLALSSLPLHLLWIIMLRMLSPKLTYHSYNAAIFKITVNNEYSITLMASNSVAYKEISNKTTSVRLENTQWKEMYGKEYVSKYGDLYLGIDSIAWDSLIYWTSGMNEYLPSNVTGGTKGGSWQTPTAEGWASSGWLRFIDRPKSVAPKQVHFSEGYTIDTGRYSRIQINLYFMVVVLVFNFFKVAVMLGTLMRHRSDYIVTLGDAAASFLEHPEELTEGKCTLETDNLFASYGHPDQVDGSAVTKDERSKQSMRNTWRPRSRRYCSSIGFDKAWSAILS